MGVIALGPAMESGLWAGRPRGEILRALANAADDDTGECFPSYEYTAFIAGVGRSTAHREIRALEFCGLVELVEAGGGRRKSNRYRVNAAMIELCAQRVRAAKRAAAGNAKARIDAQAAARDYCERVFAILERMLRRIGAAEAAEPVKANAARRAIETATAFLQNRPPRGRFRGEGNRPAGDENRPAAWDKNRPAAWDPNLQGNSHSEETRARAGDAAPDGASPGADAEGAPAASAAPGGEFAGSGTGDAGRRAAIPEGLRHRARDLVAQWVLSGDVERFAAKALRVGLGPETPGIASLADFHIPGFDFDGPQAADFIARIPARGDGGRGGVVTGFDWCERWVLGDPNEPNNPEKPFGAVVAAMRKTLAWSARDGGAPAALTPAQRERLEWLREGVARERAAQGDDTDTDNQSTEEAA